MKVLAIDTATLMASAAVVEVTDDGTTAPVVLASGEAETDRHSERLLPAIAGVLERAGLTLAQIDAIAVGAGPGSFTGLRIGLATAKGLAFATGKPLWLVSSLAALACDLAVTAAEGALLVAALDARRHEIYVGCYRRAGATLVAVGPERVVPPAELAALIAAADPDEGPVELAGDALTVHAVALAGLPARVRHRSDVRPTPSAVGVALMGATGTRADRLAHGAPAYIRPSEAEVLYPDGVPGARARR